MRCSLLTTFLTLPGLAWAADVPLPAPVTEAEIYLQGATLHRSGSVELPAGSHRLLVPYSDGSGLPDIELAGATLGAVEVLPNAVADGRIYLTETQQAAYDALLAAREAGSIAQDARQRADAAVTAAEDQLAFLRSVGGDSLTSLDTEAMLNTFELLGTRVQMAEIARTDASVALREATRAVEEAGRRTAQAQLDLEATGAQLGSLSLMAVGLTMAEAGTVDLNMEYFTPGAGWGTRYDLKLGADDMVTLDRKVEVWQRAGLPLINVAITLSTADPFAQTAPQEVYPNQARLQQDEEIMQSGALRRIAPGTMAEADFAAAPEPVVVAQANFDGPVVTYDYPTPVTLPVGGRVTLALDSHRLDARVFNRANPRLDDTAFLMAEVTNSTGEPLLPGPAVIYRENSRIGETNLPLMPAGDEVELAFGPQQHLRLEFVRLENATGDRGLFFTSGTRRQDMVFRVRNLSDTTEAVEARFALPYSEEEDLEVSVTPRPAPDARDVEDQRSVAQWNLEVAGGADVSVEIGVTLEWPEGKTLIWQP
ncbi:conserved hypothetical protein [Jannaschia faecimaris]|uniref:DUF4139 domain-containing protein n=1 Tax=Jannaschia faecimaris TaxID=1244108 RepID=A0A1H3IPY8_9RHOB|nr:DUF4139 domain-containing protein [Jannaschia faecimaris]SDY29329.1 conserved hypothetical protein [Jannaschia faecimaris]